MLCCIRFVWFIGLPVQGIIHKSHCCPFLMWLGCFWHNLWCCCWFWTLLHSETSDMCSEEHSITICLTEGTLDDEFCQAMWLQNLDSFACCYMLCNQHSWLRAEGKWISVCFNWSCISKLRGSTRAMNMVSLGSFFSQMYLWRPNLGSLIQY